VPISLYFLAVVLFIASWTDWKQRIIPNSLLLPFFFVALIVNTAVMGIRGLLWSFEGLLAGFALLLVPYLLSGIGAGDVKLLMLIGTFGGVRLAVGAFLLGAVIGGFFSLGVILYNMISKQKISTLPYGIPLTLGTVFCIFSGNGM